ncbi:MAG: hypothetical protein IPH17_07980 [Bacteroidales bacterium]|nr:hypothetical protein [Bacteroidales bacterium]
MDELLMDYSEKGRIYKNAEELKRARKQKPKKVAVLAATDRAGNLLFKKFDGKKLSSEQIEQFLKAKMPKDGVMCSSNKKAFKKVRRNVIKHKEIVTSHRQKRGIYSLKSFKKKLVNSLIGYISNLGRSYQIPAKLHYVVCSDG